MNYPKLNVKELPKVVEIIEQAVADPDYLDPSNCPYDGATIQLIRNAMKATDKGVVVQSGRSERGKVGRPTKQIAIPLDEVEREIDEIRKELADLKIDGRTMETSDRIQVIKTRAALIERVLAMKERIGGVKEFNSFVTNVIGIMQDHIDPANRETLIMELKRYAEQ